MLRGYCEYARDPSMVKIYHLLTTGGKEKESPLKRYSLPWAQIKLRMDLMENFDFIIVFR